MSEKYPSEDALGFFVRLALQDLVDCKDDVEQRLLLARQCVWLVNASAVMLANIPEDRVRAAVLRDMQRGLKKQSEEMALERFHTDSEFRRISLETAEQSRGG
jgi:hypothetical protein